MRLIFALLACAAILCGRAEASQARHHFTTVEIAASAKVAGQYELMQLAQVGQMPAWPPLQPASAPYVGPGDTYVGTPFLGVSCSRAFTAAYAAGSGSLCEVQRTSDSTKCTLKAATSGFADLTTAYCNSNTQTIVQFCNATTCGIDQAFDQTGNARHLIQVTPANQPPLVFSSTPNGARPAINCGTTANTYILATSGNITQAQPLSTFAVSITNTNAAIGGLIGDQGGSIWLLASNGTANTIRLAATTIITATASDGSWHALGSLANGAASALNVDGSDTASLNAGGTNIAGVPMRLCRSNSVQFAGIVAEAWIWNSTTTSTDRNSLSSNAHGASSGYNF